MKLILKSTLLLLFAILAMNTSEAQCTQLDDGSWIDASGAPCVNSVVSAVPFLRIVADARSAGMGDVGLAISADPNAMHFNASKLVFAEKKAALSATYTPWLRSLNLNDVYLAYLTGYFQLDKLQAIGFGLRFFSLGSIQFTDVNGTPLNVGKPNEFELSLAYSRKLSDYFSAGITGKFIYSNLAAGNETENGDIIDPAVAGAADVSFTYKKDDLAVALALTNIGSKITYTRQIVKDYLPANIGLGAAYTMELDGFNKLTLAADINKLMVPTPCLGTDCDTDPVDGIDDYRQMSPIQGIFSSFGDAPGGFKEELKELTYSIGAEYWYDDQFAVRAGYFYEHAQKGNRKYFTVGIGLKYNVFGMNVSYLVPASSQRNPLDNTFRFSLLFDFESFKEGE